jgi:hypothetical protein
MVDQITKLVSIAASSYASTNEILKIRAFLKYEKGNEIYDSLTGETKIIFQLIKKAFTERMVMNLSRMLETPSGKIENLALAFNILQDPEVLGNAADRGNQKELESAIDQWKNLPLEQERKLIKALRDYVVSHNIPSKQKTPPLFRDLYNLINVMVPIVEDYSFGVGANMNSFEAAESIHKKWVSAFWTNFE